MITGAVASEPVVPFVFEGDLRDLPKAPAWRPGDPIKEIPRRHYFSPDKEPSRPEPEPRRDPLLDLQAGAPRAPVGDPFSIPLLNFAGQDFTGVDPPDTVGDVGPSYYIQMVNGSGGALFTIYNSADGSVVAGPTALDSLFGSGNCASGFGDPIVLYDPLADRWLMSEFAFLGNHLCVYVSQNSNPVTGGWYAYDFITPNFPDYPKYAVWPDAFYVTSNEPGAPAIYALDRAAMLAGLPATSQRFTAPALAGFGFQALTPADLDGAETPPAGAPGLIMRHNDDEAHGGGGTPAVDTLEIFEFDVDWMIPANSTFTGPFSISVTDFDSNLCGLTSFSCIPQPAGPPLDPLREVVMWRLQYRNLGSREVLIGNLVTDVDGTDRAGVRWFELTRTGVGPWTLAQEGTFAPDAHSRWMGAIAMDNDGNIAVGYNVASSTLNPGLRYVGRIAGDPVGTLPQGEYSLIEGSASNASNRYGDYSAMSVDPTDDCTFWFTGEYNASTSWSTQIGAFKFDTCAQDPTFTLDVTPPSQSVCAPDDAVYSIDVGSLLGFNDPVTLSVSGNPAGTNSSFSVNPVVPPGTSELTIGNTGAAAAGGYALEVTGTSATQTKMRSAGLDLFTAAPGAPTLIMPANGATEINLRPTFSWSASSQAEEYTLEVDDSPGFGSPEFSTTTPGTSATPASPLEPETTYYWRVYAANACGPGAMSATFSFTTLATAPILLVDDDDNAPDVRSYFTDTLDALGLAYDVWDTAFSTSEPTAADLAEYPTVIWFSGDVFTLGGEPLAGPNADSEAALATWLDAPGRSCLLLSSQDYLYDMGGLGADTPTSFMQNYLGLSSGSSDVGQTTVMGVGSFFGGLGPFGLVYPPSFVNFSDVLSPAVGAELAFSGDQGDAAINRQTSPPAGLGDRTAYLGFPFPALPTAIDRQAVLQAFLEDCFLIFADGFESGDTSAWSSTVPP